MKKILLKSLIFGAAALMAFSCAQEALSPEPLPGEEQEFYGNDIIRANVEIPSPSTRTALEADSSTVVWSKGDALSVIASTGNNSKFTIIEGVGEKSASFVGTVEGSGPFTAIYPYSEEASVTDGKLSFKLPQNQIYATNSFGIGASPMVATPDDIASGLEFRNICGLVCIKVTAKGGVKISKVVIKDLAGNMLWGDCTLALDGKQGTSGQTMTVSGGSNEVTLTLSSPLGLLPASPRKFYIAVPPGSFDRGFSVTLYDNSGEVYNVFQTQNPSAKVERSMISNMIPIQLTEYKTEPSDPIKRGYYKDLFMNGGIALTSRTVLPACPYIGWDYEYFASASTACAEDTTLQAAIFSGNEDDSNGILLYPDRTPRFRVVYFNGGNSRNHGKSLGTKGRKTMFDYVYNGGSYVGTCAGAFIACKGYDSNKNYSYYIKMFPGHMYHTGISKDTTDMTMPANCPLRKYFKFGETVNRIYHNGGGYMSEDDEFYVPGTEILLRYANCPSGKSGINGLVSGWAYKPNSKAGRMVLLGSHPEGVTSGERRDLFSAMLLYAADGHGDIPVKAALKKGEEYDCSAMASENKPAHARIGDKQYHHFTVDIPEGAKEITVELLGEIKEDDLYLSMHKGGPAWFSEADYTLTGSGCEKTLRIKNLEAGTWNISVYAPNTVKAAVSTFSGSGKYYRYTGDLTLLEGVPYSIKVDWE